MQPLQETELGHFCRNKAHLRGSPSVDAGRALRTLLVRRVRPRLEVCSGASPYYYQLLSQSFPDHAWDAER